jgi:hypothetical protein
VFFNGSRARKPVQYRLVKIQVARFRSIKDIKQPLRRPRCQPQKDQPCCVRQTCIAKFGRSATDLAAKKTSKEPSAAFNPIVVSMSPTTQRPQPRSFRHVKSMLFPAQRNIKIIVFRSIGAARRVSDSCSGRVTRIGSTFRQAKGRFPVKMDHSMIHDHSVI